MLKHEYQAACETAEQSASTHVIKEVLFENKFLLTSLKLDQVSIASAYLVAPDATSDERKLVVASHNGEHLELAMTNQFLTAPPERARAQADRVLQGIEDAAVREVVRRDLIDLAGMAQNKGLTAPSFADFSSGMASPAFSAVLRENGAELWNELDKSWETKLPALEQEVDLEKLPLEKRLEKEAFQMPVLLTGGAGLGKTDSVREFAAEKGYNLVELQCTASTEAIDLYGQMLPSRLGHGVEFVDGPLTEAFRAAASGQKTVLLIDELLRMQDRHRDGFLSGLAQGRAGADGGTYYKLVVQGCAVENETTGKLMNEVIKAPSKNLFIVATTNIGMDYQVGEMDTALADRFKTVHVKTDPDRIKEIITSHAAMLGMEKAAKPLNTFLEQATGLADAGVLAKAPTMRMLISALNSAKVSGEEAPGVKRQVQTLATRLVERDSNGEPNAQQLNELRKVIDNAFKGLEPAGRTKGIKMSAGMGQDRSR